MGGGKKLRRDELKFPRVPMCRPGSLTSCLSEQARRPTDFFESLVLTYFADKESHHQQFQVLIVNAGRDTESKHYHQQFVPPKWIGGTKLGCENEHMINHDPEVSYCSRFLQEMQFKTLIPSSTTVCSTKRDRRHQNCLRKCAHDQ